jgi:uncharacterized membrane protein
MIKYLPELLEAGIISNEVSQDISNYYLSKKKNTQNWLFTIFTIIGSCLIGLGIILIVAHNWESFPKNLKLSLSILPMLIGQLLCIYLLVKKCKSIPWKEGSAIFFFLTIGACVAMISQTYNLYGDSKSFMLTWMLMGIPIAYLMKSSVVSIFSLLGITYYVSFYNRWSGETTTLLIYCGLLLLVLPYILWLNIKHKKSNFTLIYNWLLPFCLFVALLNFEGNSPKLLRLSLMSLFGLFILIGSNLLSSKDSIYKNGYYVFGHLTTVIALLVMSRWESWDRFSDRAYEFSKFIESPSALSAIVLSGLALILFVKRGVQQGFAQLEFGNYVFLLFILASIIGSYTAFTFLIVNLILFIYAIIYILKGTKERSLAMLNYGVLILALQIIVRFFESEVSFIIKGIVFLIVGIGFFVINYSLIKKRNSYEK